jgi:hypothetical protein
MRLRMFLPFSIAWGCEWSSIVGDNFAIVAGVPRILVIFFHGVDRLPKGLVAMSCLCCVI